MFEKVKYVVDDALNGRRFGADPHAIIRGHTMHKYPSRIVEFIVDGEQVQVAVHSYLDVKVHDWEAIDLAKDYLTEIGLKLEGEPRIVR